MLGTGQERRGSGEETPHIRHQTCANLGARAPAKPPLPQNQASLANTPATSPSGKKQLKVAAELPGSELSSPFLPLSLSLSHQKPGKPSEAACLRSAQLPRESEGLEPGRSPPNRLHHCPSAPPGSPPPLSSVGSPGTPRGWWRLKPPPCAPFPRPGAAQRRDTPQPRLGFGP